MIFRITKTEDYTVMSNYHLRDKNLTLKAKGLLSWMLSNDDDWDYSIAGIVANCKESETAIKSTLKELQENGYVVVTKMPPDLNNNRIHYIYDVHEKPVKSLDPDFLDLETLDVENHTQRNTKIRNTKIRKNNNSKELLETRTEEPVDFLVNKPKKKNNLYTNCISLIDDFCKKHGNKTDLAVLLKNYLDMKVQMKDIQYANQWKGLLNKLEKLVKDYPKNQMEDIVQQSLDRGYRSFFPVSKGYNNISLQPSEQNVQCTVATEEEKEEQLRWQQEMVAQGRKISY